MRSRKEITDVLEDSDKQRHNAHLSVEMETYHALCLTLEVMLDIRELLEENRKERYVKTLFDK